MITVSKGLKISLVVLELLRNEEDLQGIDIGVDCFQNCRENGLTFTIHRKTECKTWCVYEHRNSDDIIINSKENWTSCNGDLPYKADSKSIYDMLFSYDEYDVCADYLKEAFINYSKE